MRQNKDAIFIPGNGMTETNYPQTLTTLRESQFIVRPLAPPWGESLDVLHDFVRQQLDDFATPETVLIGHSVGADLALRGAMGRRLSGLVLASLSVTCFAEARRSGAACMVAERAFPRQSDEIVRYSIDDIAQAVDPAVKAHVLIGGNEAENAPYMLQHALFAHRALDAGLSVIPGAVHFPEYNPHYVSAIAAAAVQVTSPGPL